MIRIGVIGAGSWGKNHVRTFASLEGAELTAVADERKEVRAVIARQYPGTHCFDDGAALIAAPHVDAVVIAAPSPVHAPLARAALEAGKHVLVEKPLALNVRDAEQLVEASRRAGRVLMVGHLMLYHGAVQHLKKMLDDGQLGDLLYVYCERVNLGVIRRDENALWSLGPHDLSVALFLMGAEFSDVTARGAAYLQPNVHDVVFANVRYRDGRMANIHMSWLDPHKSRRIVVVGSRKMAVFDDMQAQEKIRIFDKGAERIPATVGFGEYLTVRSGDILIPKISQSEPLRTEAEHFIACVRDGVRPQSDGRQGLDVVRLLEAAQRSLESGGRPVSLDAAKVGR
ncbi:MAG: Gfo/Idh/MocA family oxidoreductase [Acidobacteriota bacterium]|nr:MAG: Gfo/Idh/MocA family oxidoreductase [Acidobacteriota bacterium]